ncbi:UNVERIFIED_CONTAM: hypothetical protein K2H54_048501 [Gekko kuhli]
MLGPVLVAELLLDGLHDDPWHLQHHVVHLILQFFGLTPELPGNPSSSVSSAMRMQARSSWNNRPYRLWTRSLPYEKLSSHGLRISIELGLGSAHLGIGAHESLGHAPRSLNSIMVTRAIVVTGAAPSLVVVETSPLPSLITPVVQKIQRTAISLTLCECFEKDYSSNLGAKAMQNSHAEAALNFMIQRPSLVSGSFIYTQIDYP